MRMLTYADADVCWRMLTYIVGWICMLTHADVYYRLSFVYGWVDMCWRWRMLTYADVCWRVLTYADVCWRMLTYAGWICSMPIIVLASRLCPHADADVCWRTYADACWRMLTYILGWICTMPIIVLASRLCPEGMEGTMYALIMRWEP